MAAELVRASRADRPVRAERRNRRRRAAGRSEHPVFCSAHGRSPSIMRIGRSVDDCLESRAHVSDETHVLAFEPQIGRVHLDELPDEDSRARVVFGPVAVGIGQGRADQIIHELELTANRDSTAWRAGSARRCPVPS